MAFHAGLGVKRVYVSSRSRPTAESLADRLRAQGLEAVWVENPEEVLDQVTLIVLATTSSAPVISEAVREDAFIAAVGSFSPQRAEAPAGLVRRCRLYVDTLEGARTEAGDLILAGVDWDRVTPLQDVPLRLDVAGPVLYKSVGCACLDLAAARLAVKAI